MSDGPGYHNRQPVLAAKIYNLLSSLSPSTYDEIAPKIEYWIEYVITEQLTTVDDLVERLSSMTWGRDETYDIARFLKGFRDAPHRSERARSFVDEFSIHILRWFAIAAADNFSSSDFSPSDRYFSSSQHWKFVTSGGSIGFLRAASFVGHLIECSLLNHGLVRRHLIKPLIAHHGYNIHRARAIYQLFVISGKTLLQGLLEPGDVQVCFETLVTSASRAGIRGYDAARLDVRCDPRLGALHYDLTCGQELREIHAAWLQRREEERRDVAETEQENGTPDEVPVEVGTPVAFVPQDLPSAAINIEPPFILHDVESFPETFEVPTGTPSSPTLSISTISDFTPTEPAEERGESSDEQMFARHETFYLEDGNVEIVCGRTVFRIHSPVVSFSSKKLRDMLSPSTLLNAPMPEGCPRIVVQDSSDDFTVLLKMIYTPG
jgi:hypothetical protein